jgi:uncharacterized membrane protein
MTKTRLEAFSDGVLAIIITIMVLELKMPHSNSWFAIKPLLPVFLSYMLSFIFIGIYWGNHHHLLHTVKKVSVGIMLANLHLLFWLSLLPAATSWMGINHFAPNTVALYSIVSLLSAIAYGILQNRIIKNSDERSALLKTLKKQMPKTLISIAACLLAVPLAYVNPIIPGIMFLIQSIIWLVPDKNVEIILTDEL